MAKRTRYPNRTSSRASAKRQARSAGTSATTPERAFSPSEPIDVDASFESFDAMPLRSSSGLSEAEILRAEQLEAEATAKERAAIAASLRRQAGRAETRELVAAHGDINAPLSVRMAHEYAYVARDVRRILLTASLMVAILAVLAILINVLGVIKL
jgi:phage FluMu protein gp41